jgi:hypothetical protein
VTADLLILVAPPLALFAFAAAICVWLSLGERARQHRQAEILAALQTRPAAEIEPRPIERQRAA